MGESPQGSDYDWGDPLLNCMMTSNEVYVDKLVSVATHGNEEVFGPWVDLSASATVDGGRVISHSDEMGSWDEYLDGGITLYLSYDAQPDERSVKIVRIGAIGETTDDDGTVHGDSTYSYQSKEIIPGLDPLTHWVDEINTQNFQASYTGNWQPTSMMWSWSPLDSSDTLGTHYQDMPFGNMNDVSAVGESWDGTPTGTSQKIIVYTVKDITDGAEARAKYVLTLHDKYESRNNDPASTVETHRFDFSPKIWSVCEASASEPLDVAWNVNWTGSVSMNFFSSLNLAPETLVKWGIGVDFNASATLAVSAPGTGATTIPIGQMAFPYLEYDVTTKHYLVDEYSPVGKVNNPARINAAGGINDGSWPHAEDKLTDVYPRWSVPVDINSGGEEE